MSWVPVSKGNALPNRAIQAGATQEDGVLYVGRAASGEIGKFNVHSGAPGGNVHNLWCHHGKDTASGDILVCGPLQKAFWAPYRKGDPLPEGAFHAGWFKEDGALYVGRLGPSREVGKINIDNGVPGGRMHNLRCHHTGLSTAGEILCITEDEVHSEAEEEEVQQSAATVATSSPQFSAVETKLIKENELDAKIEVAAEKVAEAIASLVAGCATGGATIGLEVLAAVKEDIKLSLRNHATDLKISDWKLDESTKTFVMYELDKSVTQQRVGCSPFCAIKKFRLNVDGAVNIITADNPEALQLLRGKVNDKASLRLRELNMYMVSSI